VDCKEFNEQITPAVDQLLPKAEMDSFVEHARKCPACRCEYESESLTKEVVRTKAGMIKTPGEVIERILEQLSLEENRSMVTQGWSWARMVRRPLFAPALAVAAACVAVAVIFAVSRQSYSQQTTLLISRWRTIGQWFREGSSHKVWQEVPKSSKASSLARPISPWSFRS
jgi:hypothetical protein